MVLKALFFIFIVILFIQCSSTAEPEKAEAKLIAESVNFAYDMDYLNTQPVLDVDFTFEYYFRNSGGQLTKYYYWLKDLKSGIAFGSGWKMNFFSMRPYSMIRFYEESEKDTLKYSKLFMVSDKDTIYKEFTFELKGFYCDTLFREAGDTLSLQPFRYVFKDTICLLPR